MSKLTTSTPVVVVDSNTIVHGAWYLDSPEWSVLLHQSKTGRIRLVVPEIVVREVDGRFAQTIGELSDQAKAKANQLARLTRNEPVVPDIDTTRSTYNSILSQVLANNEVVTAKLPDINVDDLVDRAISRRRPFDGSGSGFRDALLWSVVLDAIATNPGCNVVLITNDRKAFYATPDELTLHTHLVSELAERDISNRLLLFPDIGSYLDSEGIEDRALTARVLKAIAEQQTGLVGKATGALRDAELGSRLVGVQVRVDVPRVVSVELDRLSGTADALLLVHMDIDAHADLAVHVHRDGEEFARTVPTPLSVSCTATLDSDGHFSDLRLDLPSADTLAAVRRELLSVDPGLFGSIASDGLLRWIAQARETNTILQSEQIGHLAEALAEYKRAEVARLPGTAEAFAAMELASPLNDVAARSVAQFQVQLAGLETDQEEAVKAFIARWQPVLKASALRALTDTTPLTRIGPDIAEDTR